MRASRARNKKPRRSGVLVRPHVVALTVSARMDERRPAVDYGKTATGRYSSAVVRMHEVHCEARSGDGQYGERRYSILDREHFAPNSNA